MRKSKKGMCKVKGCLNHKSEGVFVGDMCSPCYEMITTGNVGHSSNFIFTLKDQRDFFSALYKRCEKELQQLRRNG